MTTFNITRRSNDEPLMTGFDSRKEAENVAEDEGLSGDYYIERVP